MELEKQLDRLIETHRRILRELEELVKALKRP